MNTLRTLAMLFLMAALAFSQQNSLVQTSLAAAVTGNTITFTVASATGINAPTVSQAGSALFIQDKGQTGGELVQVTGVSGTRITVARTGRASNHASGAMVLVATSPDWFYSVDPQGSCTRATTYVAPYLNAQNGNQWICSTETGTWVKGWGNATGNQAQIVNSTATASVAGATAIAGPFLKISGTEAITSFTMSTGWNGQGFCVYPTGAFTTVAGNNIAEASTADANQVLCFTYDVDGGVFSPSY